jgi:single-strand DNA-binding protein
LPLGHTERAAAKQEEVSVSISYCHVTIAGYLTRDVELRYTPKGTAVADVSIAVNHRWKGDDGQEHEEVSFFSCVAWGRTAEVMGQYLKKGKPVLIDGRLKQESWDDKQTGQKKYAVKIIIGSFQFLGTKDDDGAETQPAKTAKPAWKAAGVPPPADNDDSDIPF